LYFVPIMDPAAHILIVDDHAEIRDLLGRFLRKHGFRVTEARDGDEMRRILTTARIDLIILDLMLPGDDGLTLCRELRAKSEVPIIMLTAMNEQTDRIVGLEMGADDYVPKPFNPRELLARVKAVLRRTTAGLQSGTGGEQLFRFAGWTLDVVKRELQSPNGVVVDLTTGEYDLLLAFIEHPQRVLNRDQLLDLARSRTSIATYDRSIDVQISRLRRKIEDEASPTPLIKTIRSVGYLFTAPVEKL
jgi:two-component system OmpR family response regulator